MQPAHLVGNSYGAFLCLLLAVRDASLVRTLVLAEPPVLTLFVSNDPTPLELLKLLVTRPRTAVGIVRLGAQGIDPAMKPFKRGDRDDGLRTFIDAVLRSGAYDRLPERKKEQVQRVKEPTLLVNGEESIGLFHRLTDRLEELLLHSERTEIPEASHVMHEENAPAYNSAVQSFVEKLHHTA